jgi:ligand-binding sensor domain-containing protein
MVNSGITTNGLTSILYDNEQNFFMGSVEQGLIKFTQPSTWEIVDTSNSLLPDNHILCLAQDVDGQIWIGTSIAGVVVIKKNTNSLSEIATEEIKVFPNPFNDVIRIRSTADNLINSYSLIAMDGQIMISMENLYTSPNIEINTSYLSSGIYILKMNTQSGIRTVKISKP